MKPTFTKMKPKILIGTITYDSDWYCLKEFSESIHLLDTSSLETDMLIIDNSDTSHYVKKLSKFFPHAKIKHYHPPSELNGFNLFRHCELKCRKLIVDYFLSHDYDYLFFLDSDIICQKDVLKKLLSNNKDISCALFRYRAPPKGRPLWFIKKKPVSISPKTGVWMLDFVSNKQLHSAGNNLFEIDACGFGAVLIHRDPLSEVNLKKSPNNHYGADIHFCFDAKKAGYKIFGDPTAHSKHIYKQCERRRKSNAKAF